MARIETLTPLIGAEILDVDLSQPTAELAALVRSALAEHSVVFFRDQRLTRDQHKAFAALFGKLHVHPITSKQVPGHPEIIPIEADANSTRVAGEVWHSDASADAEPPLGSILYMKEVPPHGGGDTLFASTAAAYDALSAPMKALLDGLTAVHDGERLRDTIELRTPERRLMASEHPVVRVHPWSGRRCLYVNRVYTSHIVQLTRAESDALLTYLYQHMEQPVFQCRFKWRPNSIAFWDNRCTLHHAVWDYHPERRYADRVTVCGERPVGVGSPAGAAKGFAAASAG